MVVFGKRAKILVICALVVFAALAGKVIEHFEGKTFTEQISTTAVEETVETREHIEDGKININSAVKEELMLLDGIGEKLSERIIDYREKHGDFTQTEGIMLVPGIGRKLYDNIKDKIYIN